MNNEKYTEKNNKKYNSHVRGNFYLFAKSKTQQAGLKLGFDNNKKTEKWFEERMSKQPVKKEDEINYSDIENSLQNIEYVEKVMNDYVKNEYSTPLFRYQ